LGCGHNFTHREGLTILRPAGAGNYAFVLVKSEAEVLLDGAFRPVPPHSCVLFRPDTPQHYRDKAKPFINDWLHCECEGEDFFGGIGFPLDQVLPAKDPTLSRRILELLGVFHGSSPYRERILDCELKAFFCRLLDDGGGKIMTRGRYVRQFTALRSAIYGSPQTPVTVDDLAREVNLSRSHFQHLYRELFGVPVMTDIISSRLEYAKHLLRGGGLAVTAVARLCGYENDAHFIRQFKKMVGTTPGRYRRENGGA
jgi:AraC family transcriptional regulator of arabinose operon